MAGCDRMSRDVEEVHSFLRVHAAAASEAAHQQVLQAQCMQLVAKFQSSRIGMSEATRILEALSQGPWSAEQNKGLREACAGSAMTGSTSTSQKTQLLLDPDQYMTASMWKFLQASAFSEQSKLHSYCMYLNKLGLGHPSEQTAKHCTAKLWLIVRGEQALQLDGAAMLALSEEFKSTMDKFPKPATALPKYPSEPTFWQPMQPELYAKMYEVEPPLPSKLDHAAVARLLQGWPCRKTNKRVGGPGVLSQAGSSGNPMMCMQQMIANTVQNVVQQLSPYRVPEANIQLLGGNLRGRAQLARGCSEVQMALAQQQPATGILPLAQPAFPHQDEPLGLELPGRMQDSRAFSEEVLDSPSGPRIAAADHVDAFEAEMHLAVAARAATAKKAAAKQEAAAKKAASKEEAAAKKAASKEEPAARKVPAAKMVPAAKKVTAAKKVLKHPAAAGAPHAPVLKRPAAAAGAPPALKRPAGSPMAGGHDARPAVPLDGPPADVLLYLGGRIYDDAKQERLRCYRQIGDKVEKSISYKAKSRADCFLVAFQDIENDPRAQA